MQSINSLIFLKINDKVNISFLLKFYVHKFRMVVMAESVPNWSDLSQQDKVGKLWFPISSTPDWLL